jgi:ABC-type transport system involved in cytochrome c biogenesis ATPase subunit
VAREASGLLNRIAGAPLGALRLEDGLTPGALVPASWNEAVELAQLSGGENEQIHFATRLALADRLSAHEPQLVVFDDVLMATDPARLARILELLDQRRGRLQVLILTCHPERFSALAGAHRVNFNRPCPSPSGQT